ncbi:hypothetical protein [Clostridium botulinum]|uniref:hypothetical protein n=1 Tax=Clostridium botulinum TaxID=1491 RepID=UPI003DA28EF2
MGSFLREFISVSLDIKNNWEEATGYEPHEFKLNNGKKTYEVDDNSFEALGHLNSQESIFRENKSFIGSYDKINTGISKNTFLVFDIPKDVKIDNLKLVTEHNKEIQFNLK